MMVATEPAFDPAICAVCGSRDGVLVFEHRGRAFTSDGRTIPRDIRKVQCRNCGAARRGDPFNQAERDRHYASEYRLAASAVTSEPLFFTASGTVPRSQAIADWVHAEVAQTRSESPRTVLEIGCGEGSVIRRLTRRWPEAHFEGLDLGFAGRVDDFEIRRGSYIETTGKFDLIYSFAVIEHVSSPRHFLHLLGSSLSPHGLLVVALPRLESGSRDLLFYDHLHHLHSTHVARLGELVGLIDRRASTGHGALGDFGLHVFERAAGTIARPTLTTVAPPADVRQTISAWTHRCHMIDKWLTSVGTRRLMVWGLGEGFGLLSTYSTLGSHVIDVGIDDNPDRFSGAQFPFPVCRLEDVPPRHGEDAVVLLTFTPAPLVVQRLRTRRLQWCDAISGEIHSC